VYDEKPVMISERHRLIVDDSIVTECAIRRSALRNWDSEAAEERLYFPECSDDEFERK
jgi:hypothetical protein